MSSVPPGWYDDPQTAGVRRWWDGWAWTDQLLTPPRPSDTRPVARRSLWPVWLTIALVTFLGGLLAVIAGGVRIDHTTGHFGRIEVPGESYGLPDAGTYVIADGDYAAGQHESPTFTVTGPHGERVPVQEVASRVYGREDNALALFHVPAAGRYRLQVSADGHDPDLLPRTVTVDRSMDGTGDSLTPAYIAVAAGLGVLLIALAFAIVTVTSVVRRVSRPG
jgi:hypothetical protein